MSTLQETLQQRRTATLPPGRSCDLAKEPRCSLQIQCCNGGNWVFPWAHFQCAHVEKGDDGRLVLLFPSHEVILEGSSLELLLPEIANQHLHCVRAGPPKFSPQTDDTEPFINCVSVRCMIDAAKKNPGIVLKNDGIVQDNTVSSGV